jgi:hypothetical protein
MPKVGGGGGGYRKEKFETVSFLHEIEWHANRRKHFSFYMQTKANTRALINP